MAPYEADVCQETAILTVVTKGLEAIMNVFDQMAVRGDFYECLNAIREAALSMTDCLNSRMASHLK